MNITLREQIQYFEGAELPQLETVRRSRPYKIPKGYLDWRWISGAIAIGLYMMQEQCYPDAVAARFAMMCDLWLENNSPVYCLDSKLYRELRETEILSQRHLLKELDPGISQFILVLPDNALKTSDGNNLSYLVVDSINIKEYLAAPDSKAIPDTRRRWIEALVNEYEYQIVWSAMDDGGSVWYSGKGVTKDGKLFSEKDDIGRSAMNAGDRQFVSDVESLIFNILLLLTYEPETVTEYREASKGFKPKQPQAKAKYWLPRWIAEPPEMKVRYVATQRQQSDRHRASPHPHIRKSHWRRVPCGEKGRDRKWVRIKATKVLG